MKHAWLAVALVLGIALGLYIAREPGESGSGLPPRPEVTQAERPVAATDASDSAPRPSPSAGAAPGFAAEAGRTQAPAGIQQEYSGYQQPIDVGPVFQRHFEVAASSGNPDALAMAHRELEREMRDDSWAYAIEAEIENSLVAETSLGNFRREHVECRATMCEVRISGEGDDQATAMQNWNENLGGKTWASRLFITNSATLSENGKVNALMIFRKQNAAPSAR